MMEGKHPIDQFLYRYYSDLASAAENIGVTYQTLRKWKEKPENMLKYLLVISKRTGCSYLDVIESVRNSIERAGE